MRISDWSSDVCSSDLLRHAEEDVAIAPAPPARQRARPNAIEGGRHLGNLGGREDAAQNGIAFGFALIEVPALGEGAAHGRLLPACRCAADCRSEEHTSELQSLMRISYAVFCLKQKNTTSSQ